MAIVIAARLAPCAPVSEQAFMGIPRLAPPGLPFLLGSAEKTGSLDEERGIGRDRTFFSPVVEGAIADVKFVGKLLPCQPVFTG